MFENKMYTKAMPLNEEILLKTTGNNKKLSDISDITRNHARNIAVMASGCTDFICFMLAAERKHEKHICYRIHTPYTADNDRVSLLGQLLAECKEIQDIFYSSVTRSFLIDMPEVPQYNLSDFLLIGIAEKMRFKHNVPVFYNDKSEIFYWDTAKGLLRVRPKFNRILTYEMPGHEEALLALYNAASALNCDNGVNTIYVVSPEVKRLLPSLPTIVALDEI